MFYEIRHYVTRPGRRAEWIEYMHAVVLPYQRSKGVHLIADFVDLDEDDGYIWIRRFDDEESAARIGRAVYEDQTWTDDIAPTVQALIYVDRSVVTHVAATSQSPKL